MGMNLEGFVWKEEVREGQAHKHFHTSIDRMLFTESLLLLGQKPLYSNHPINYNGLILRVYCRESRFTVKVVL